MNKIVSDNAKLFINELGKDVIPLTEDGENISKFTLDEIDKYKCVDGVYYYPYNGEEIPFRLLSDEKILDYDKEILKDENKRFEYESVRSLRIASSHFLPGAIYMAVLSDCVKSLVRYQKNKEEYIIDYGNNVIMRRSDYEKIFLVIVLEEIDQFNLSYFKELVGICPSPLLILGFSPIMDEIRSKKHPFVLDECMTGIHSRNRYLFNIEDEVLFLTKDEKRSIWIEDLNAVFSFTLNPLALRFDISITDDDYFLYKDYRFCRLSDYIDYEPFNEELVSSKRYHKCMARSISVLFILEELYKPADLRIVIGHIPINDYECISHAWVEIKQQRDGKWVAVDYTGNVVMDSYDYVRLRDARIINYLPYSLVEELVFYYNNSCVQLDKFEMLYFAEELLRDFKKNEALYEKALRKDN